MKTFQAGANTFRQVRYANEADLEEAIRLVQDELFGRSRVYLDVKKAIGRKGGKRNIPDGYLIDLARRQPRLYVVETELAAHDPLKHVALQILEFSLAFDSEPRTVKRILFDALQAEPAVRKRCESYALGSGYPNLDHMLEWLVYESPFAALVIIDDIPDELENVLLRKFQFGVEVLQLTRYENALGERAYHFEPFLADLGGETVSGVSEPVSAAIDAGEIDTIVVPAREDGFLETFIGENRWYAIRIHGTMRPQIKYVAAYRVAPESAITHIAPVASVEPWKDTGKFVLNFSEPAREIGPIRLVKNGRVRAPQAPRYTSGERLNLAKSLDDVW